MKNYERLALKSVNIPGCQMQQIALSLEPIDIDTDLQSAKELLNQLRTNYDCNYQSAAMDAFVLARAYPNDIGLNGGAIYGHRSPIIGHFYRMGCKASYKPQFEKDIKKAFDQLKDYLGGRIYRGVF